MKVIYLYSPPSESTTDDINKKKQKLKKLEEEKHILSDSIEQNEAELN